MGERRDIQALAEEYAAQRAPLPSYEPVHAGLIGALIAAAIVVIFKGIAGLDSEAFPLAHGLTVAIGFVAPFGYLKYQERQHYKAYASEYAALQRQDDAPSTDATSA
jgi:uncharacterized membrane protein YebE (DUF533 family)